MRQETGAGNPSLSCRESRVGFGVSIWGLKPEPRVLDQLSANMLGSLALSNKDANSGSCPYCHTLRARFCSKEALCKHVTAPLNNLEGKDAHFTDEGTEAQRGEVTCL